jgi:hypothetical protein
MSWPRSRLIRRAKPSDGLLRTCRPVHRPRVQSTNRVLAIVDGRRVRLQSRQQRPLARFFPEIVDALREWFVGEVVLDGVIWGQQRRV